MDEQEPVAQAAESTHAKTRAVRRKLRRREWNQLSVLERKMIANELQTYLPSRIDTIAESFGATRMAVQTVFNIEIAHASRLHTALLNSIQERLFLAGAGGQKYRKAITREGGLQIVKGRTA